MLTPERTFEILFKEKVGPILSIADLTIICLVGFYVFLALLYIFIYLCRRNSYLPIRTRTFRYIVLLLMFSVIHVCTTLSTNGHLGVISESVFEFFSCNGWIFLIQHLVGLGGWLSVLLLVICYRARVFNLNNGNFDPEVEPYLFISKKGIFYILFLWGSGVSIGLYTTIWNTNTYDRSIRLCTTNNLSWFGNIIWTIINTLILLIIELYEEFHIDKRFRKKQFRPIRNLLCLVLFFMVCNIILQTFQEQIYVWVRHANTFIMLLPNFFMLFQILKPIMWRTIFNSRKYAATVMNSFECYDIEIKNLNELFLSNILKEEFMLWCQSEGKDVKVDIDSLDPSKSSSKTDVQHVDKNEEIVIPRISVSISKFIACYGEINAWKSNNWDDSTKKTKRDLIINTYIVEESKNYIYPSKQVEEKLMEIYRIDKSESVLDYNLFDELENVIMDRFETFWESGQFQKSLTERKIVHLYLESTYVNVRPTKEKISKKSFCRCCPKWRKEKYEKLEENPQTNLEMQRFSLNDDEEI